VQSKGPHKQVNIVVSGNIVFQIDSKEVEVECPSTLVNCCSHLAWALSRIVILDC